MMYYIDNFLNGITMYRLVLYFLIILLVVAFGLGWAGMIPYDPVTIAVSTAVILAVCWVANKLFARASRAMENVESIYITALILALIISPTSVDSGAGLGFIVFASAWAMASKYILAIGKKHVFNPAAFGVALTALAVNQSAIWWIGGNMQLLPLVLIGSLLIIRKVQRFDLAFSFSIFALGTAALTSPTSDMLTPMTRTLLHSPFFFFMSVMLTEPLTTPPGRAMRMIYGAIVGFLFAPSIHIGSIYFTPELALLSGNIFSYLASPKQRIALSLRSIKQLAANAYEFSFAPDRKLVFLPGQYLEWTLAHTSPDGRGNRRYFTIASSPTEREIRLGVKFSHPPSSFKHALGEMRQGDIAFAGQLAGNFIMPKNKDIKLVFIAGGIGVTPYRSMVQYLLDRKESRTLTLIYAAPSVADFAYRDVFERARNELGMKTIYLTTKEKMDMRGISAEPLTANVIRREIPDWDERSFYLSGPRSMVVTFQKTLRDMGVSRRKIKTDFFPGFA